MRNKKADLVNNVLTTVIAVVGLALIIFAAWKLYSAYVGQDEKNAQVVIDTIEARVNAIEEGQVASIVVRGIPGWFVTGWGKNDARRPESCYFSSCICVCKGEIGAFQGEIIARQKLAGGSELSDKLFVACKDKGFCRLLNVDSLADSRFEDAELSESAVNPVIPFVQSNLVEIFAGKEKSNNNEVLLRIGLSG